MLREFVELAERREEPFAVLCARFGISRKTGYKWLKRYQVAGPAGLRPLSRRPKTSPRRTPDTLVDAVLALRRQAPEWNAVRIRKTLLERGLAMVPAPSTIDLILRRQREAVAAQQRNLGAEGGRFEPNYRWAIRLGREVRLRDGSLVVVALIVDECTDFMVGATPLGGRREQVLTEVVGELFLRHGLPWRIRLPLEEEFRHAAPCRAHTPFTVWLMRLGIEVEFHPGAARLAEVERRAREELEVRLARLPAYQRAPLAERRFRGDVLEEFSRAAGRLNRESAPAELERLRERHNFGGQHEAMQRRTPISLFRPSVRPMPPEVPVPAYPLEAEVRLVSEKGIFTFYRRLVRVGRAFAGLCVELKPTPYSDRFVVLFAGQPMGLLDLAGAPRDHTTSLELLPC